MFEYFDFSGSLIFQTTKETLADFMSVRRLSDDKRTNPPYLKNPYVTHPVNKDKSGQEFGSEPPKNSIKIHPENEHVTFSKMSPKNFSHLLKP